MAQSQLRQILIVGGGTAGWMTAALFAQLFQGLYQIRLVESDDIGTIGVGEATIPTLKRYNELLKLDEASFMKATQASFKLGIQFNDWSSIGSSYIHGFGVIGQDLEWLRCHQYWLRQKKNGSVADLSQYSINTAAALANKFMRARADLPDSPVSEIAHAFHFDAGLYARLLRAHAERRGVIRTEGRVVDVTLRAENGFVESITMEGGQVLAADLFVDCSGFVGLLIEQALETGYEDWSRWLPCNRALAVPCARSADFTPYTRSTARGAGWQWRIPLQHRTGNGLVYASDYLDDTQAETLLLENLDGDQLADVRKIRFTTGKRRKAWNKNCVAIGLSAGFLEPLESTSLFLIQSALQRFVKLFPDSAFDATTIAEFNRQTDFEYERVRDFIILHYKATEREDTPFWRFCKTMEIPQTLAHRIELFQANGRIFRENEELFAEESWIQVFLGQGIIPQNYDPLANIKSDAQVQEYLHNIESVIAKCVELMPYHDMFVSKYCEAPK